MSGTIIRRLPVGADVQAGGGVHFRVWAPRRRSVSVVIETSGDAHSEAALAAAGGGYFGGLVDHTGPGTRYRYRLDGEGIFPDPASRFQPNGPHGPSQVVDPGIFPWTDSDWRGCDRDGQVIYELHVGSLTREGTWASALENLPALAELGISIIEVMPLADFPGTFGWGYDGVNIFAPTRLYGPPDDFRRFVDRAHALKLGVILDVVYNHLGPDGNFLGEFAPAYFTDRYKNDWGQALNFDGDDAQPVREFFLANAGYWVEEFHLDGLRLDATQQIFDSSPEHIIAAIGRRVREAARGRDTIVVAENEPQHVKLLRPLAKDGYGLDMLWNDDYHHSAATVLSGHNEAYYTDYLGAPQEFISAAKWGFLYQGQRYKWQKGRRGSPTSDLSPASFVNFLQNHDQIANSARGLRCHAVSSPGRHRALTALTILMPGTPMLFQGDEYAASQPFLFFADHKPELGAKIRKARAEFLAQFRSIAVPEIQAQLADPIELDTFERCKLDWSERGRNDRMLSLHRDLIHLRRQDPVLRSPRRGAYDGAVLGGEAFLLRFFEAENKDRLLVVNLGRDLQLDPAPEPLLASPEGMQWQIRWSSDDWLYGGPGTPPLESDENWRLPGQATVLLVAAPRMGETANEGAP